MTQHSRIPPADSAASGAHSDTSPVARAKQRYDGWSLDRQVGFLRALSATHSVTEAARSVGMARQSAYRLRSRLKGHAFDLAWEVAFHHSYDVLAHAALERALNGVEVPVYYRGEKIDTYRRYDERLTVALLGRQTMGGNPTFGRWGASAEKQARAFDALLDRIAAGEPIATGAPGPGDPGEFEHGYAYGGAPAGFRAAAPCPSTLSDEDLMAILQDYEDDA